MACALCSHCPFDGSVLPSAELPHELHITVQAAEVERFKAVCADLGVKPVLLALERQSGPSIADLMTSSSFKGSSEFALSEVHRLATALEAAGFIVLRRKIESAPWHPWAPTLSNGLTFPEGAYFESHLAVTSFEADRPFLARIAQHHRAHLSRNTFKVRDDGRVVTMLTLRSSTDPLEDFTTRRDALATDLRRNHDVDKVITEFAWYDSKQNHDAAWLQG